MKFYENNNKKTNNSKMLMFTMNSVKIQENHMVKQNVHNYLQ